MRKLNRAFFGRPAIEVAPQLLGKVLARRTPFATLRGRIVEVEAYTGQTDPGSHAYRGKTPRNALMFGPPGHVYVYISYGVNHCMNLVTEGNDVAGAVLLRALEPLAGIEHMSALRGGKHLLRLCNGPGKLCQAFGVNLAQNGADLEGSEIWAEDDWYLPEEIGTSTRIGLTNGADLPLRFYLTNNRFVSKGKPSMRMPQAQMHR